MVDKVVICGSRTINDYQEFKQIMLDFLAWFDRPIIIVHGGAKLGADAMAAKFALEQKIRWEVYEADWDKHGNSAGYKRNAEMREVADYTLAFWDGESKGTADMIENTNTAVLSAIMIVPNPKLGKFFFDYRTGK